MLYKCVHGVVVSEKYCADCNKKPILVKPGQMIGNRRPAMMKADK